jgi:hypothetical protein
MGIRRISDSMSKMSANLVKKKPEVSHSSTVRYGLEITLQLNNAAPFPATSA